MSQAKKNISTVDIGEQYFRSRMKLEESGRADRFKLSQELTASAKFIVREAKKRLGQQNAISSASAMKEEDLLRLISIVEESEGEQLSEKERTAVLAAITVSLDHYDILTPLVENEDINDIIIRAYNDISVQTNRMNIQTDMRFTDRDVYKAFVENLLKRVGKACTVATPVVDVAIDPHVRACVTHESFSPPGSGPMLTLRIARHRNISIDSLVQNELGPKVVLDYLAALVASGTATILVAGEVGTGKTTLVKALTQRIPQHEAILIIEDTHELVLNRPFVRTLLTREANTEGAGRIAPAMAIRTGMRMAMNRLILGEMRDAEAAEAFIDVCASGHCGISTIHARSARDAIARLELFLSRAQGSVSIETIRRQIANAISAVVYLGVDKQSNQRRIMEVSEIGAFSDGAIQHIPIFKYAPNNSHPMWKRESGISSYLEVLRSENAQLPLNGSLIGFEADLEKFNVGGLAQ